MLAQNQEEIENAMKELAEAGNPRKAGC